MPHQNDAAIPALLPHTGRIRASRGHPFDMELNIAEFLFGHQTASSPHHFDVSVFDLPAWQGYCAAPPRTVPLRQIFAVKQNDSVRRRSLNRHWKAGGNLARLWSRAVMNSPLLPGQRIAQRATVHLT